MKLSGQQGFGLLLLIALISVSAILMGSIVIFMIHSSNHSILRMNKVRAHYLAQGGVINALHAFITSYELDDSDASYEFDSLVQGNDTISTDFQSNYAYFLSDGPLHNASFWPLRSPSIPPTPNPAVPPNPPNSFCPTTVASFPAGNYRLYGWNVQNTHTNTSSATNDNIIATNATVRWTGTGGASNLRVSLIRVNKTTLTSGSAQIFLGTSTTGLNGVSFALSGAETSRTLTPAQRWQGPCTFIQWNGAVPDPFRVTVQFTFKDGSQSSEIVFWDGPLNGQGRPHAHTLSITSSGQSGSGALRQTKRVRALISAGVPEEPPHQMRILSWESLER